MKKYYWFILLVSDFGEIVLNIFFKVEVGIEREKGGS